MRVRVPRPCSRPRVGAASLARQRIRRASSETQIIAQAVCRFAHARSRRNSAASGARLRRDRCRNRARRRRDGLALRVVGGERGAREAAVLVEALPWVTLDLAINEGARLDALVRALSRTVRVASDVRIEARDDEGAEVAAEVLGVVVLREEQVPDVREGVQSERQDACSRGRVCWRPQAAGRQNEKSLGSCLFSWP